MPRGRPRTVTATQARAQGYYRPSRHGPLPKRPGVSNQVLEIAPGAEPEPPGWMTGAEAKVWAATVAGIAARGVLTIVGADDLELFVTLKARLAARDCTPDERIRCRRAAERLGISP